MPYSLLEVQYVTNGLDVLMPFFFGEVFISFKFLHRSGQFV
jgi:hypothetical protein